MPSILFLRSRGAIFLSSTRRFLYSVGKACATAAGWRAAAPPRTSSATAARGRLQLMGSSLRRLEARPDQRHDGLDLEGAQLPGERRHVLAHAVADGILHLSVRRLAPESGRGEVARLESEGLRLRAVAPTAFAVAARALFLVEPSGAGRERLLEGGLLGQAA